MKPIIDNFSTGAADYAQFRPESPDEVYDFLYSQVPAFDCAWDCGTGNGQVAVRLADRFRLVYATDISEEQLSKAPAKANVIYLKERAEHTSLKENTIDLITVGQAIHWFDFDRFYTEVNRVARPGALVAAWTYNLLKMTPAINRVIEHLYHDITSAYWDKERKLVDEGYRTIPFPFEEIETPEFSIVRHWNIEQVAGYLRTWSGVRHYLKQKQQDPVSLVLPDLHAAWGDKVTVEVRWPVFMRAGRIHN